MRRIEEVKVVHVVQVRFTRGEGTMSDPVRVCTRFYGFGGELLAEDDPIGRFVPAKTG